MRNDVYFRRYDHLCFMRCDGEHLHHRPTRVLLKGAVILPNTCADFRDRAGPANPRNAVAFCTGAAIEYRSQPVVRAFDFGEVAKSQSKQFKFLRSDPLNRFSELRSDNNTFLLCVQSSTVKQTKASKENNNGKEEDGASPKHKPPYSTTMTPRIIVWPAPQGREHSNEKVPFSLASTLTLTLPRPRAGITWLICIDGMRNP